MIQRFTDFTPRSGHADAIGTRPLGTRIERSHAAIFDTVIGSLDHHPGDRRY